MELSDAERAIIASAPLLSLRDMIVALNVADDALGSSVQIDELQTQFPGINFVQIAVQAETEIAQLDTTEEREEFMAALGIEEIALQALTRLCIDALGRLSFFTAGPTELRQWFLRRGSSAPQAAGAIHSDLERGFIRAEVMKYSDLDELGSEDALKSAGKHHLKGKDYIVEDGDVITIRFNV